MLKSFNASNGVLKIYESRRVSGVLYHEVTITMICISGTAPPPVKEIPWPGMFYGLHNITGEMTDGFWKIDYTFVSPAGGLDAQYGDAGSVDTSSALTSSVSSSPITMHPKIGYLVQQFATGVKDGKVLWKETLDTGGTNGLDKDGNAISNANPFANVDIFMEGGATWSASKSFPYRQAVDLNFYGIGKISNGSPIGNLPGSGTRNWLYAGFSFDQRGAAYTYKVNYLLSGPGGWNKLIY
jgi:hypothetical protein